MVLPIWEGAGNIMTLDMLRAVFKSKGIEVMYAEIDTNIPLLNKDYQAIIKKELEEIKKILSSLQKQEQEIIEATAKPLFERLTLIYQLTLLAYYKDEFSEG